MRLYFDRARLDGIGTESCMATKNRSQKDIFLKHRPLMTFFRRFILTYSQF